MAENPFNRGGMTDLGLLSQVSGDVLGNPDKVQELQSQLAGLQATLAQPPPQQNSMAEAAIQGALAGTRGILEDPLTGEQMAAPPQGGFGEGLLAGIAAGIEGKQAESLAEYQQRQKLAQDALDQREKLSAGIRMVLAQNPLAFEALGATPEGQRVLGQLAYGIDIPIDPTAKSREADETLLKKQRMSYFIKVAQAATDPSARASAMQALKDMVDPDGKLSVGVSDMVQGRIPSYSEIGNLYGDAGLQALNKYRIDGDVEALMTRLGSLRMKDASKAPTSIQVKLGLAQKIARIKKDYSEANGKELTDGDAIKQLPEEDRINAETFLKNVTGGANDVPFTKYTAELQRAWDDQPQDVRDSSPEQAWQDARNLAWHRITAARDMKKKVEAADKRIVTPPVVDAKNAPDIASWQKQVVARAKKNSLSIAEANKALVAEMIQAGKGDSIPAVARKKAGM